MTAIEVCGVRKSFKGHEVLHGLTMQVEQGEIVGLVGPSGCGKTTLVDLIVGLTVPEEGRVRLIGEEAPYRTVRRRLGFMPQDTALYEDITGTENLRFFGALYGMRAADIKRASGHALELARLEEQGNKLVRDYSGGMKRRLSLAVALLTSPEILVLDEPTIGLDPVHREKLWRTFRELAQAGSSILITTHMMDEAARCDRIALIREGTLIRFDAPAAIVEESGRPDLEGAFITLAEAGETATGRDQSIVDSCDQSASGGRDQSIVDSCDQSASGGRDQSIADSRGRSASGGRDRSAASKDGEHDA